MAVSSSKNLLMIYLYKYFTIAKTILEGDGTCGASKPVHNNSILACQLPLQMLTPKMKLNSQKKKKYNVYCRIQTSSSNRPVKPGQKTQKDFFFFSKTGEIECFKANLLLYSPSGFLKKKKHFLT